MTLTTAERHLIESVEKGKAASYATGIPGQDDPRRGNNWGENRTIRAGIIRKLVTGDERQWKVGPRGIWIYGAKITGLLDLRGISVRYPIRIEHSLIIRPVLLQDASTLSLSFAGSYLAG